MIVFPCPGCGADISAGEDRAGTLFVCPSCRIPRRVPQPDPEDPPAPRPRRAGRRENSAGRPLRGNDRLLELLLDLHNRLREFQRQKNRQGVGKVVAVVGLCLAVPFLLCGLPMAALAGMRAGPAALLALACPAAVAVAGVVGGVVYLRRSAGGVEQPPEIDELIAVVLDEFPAEVDSLVGGPELLYDQAAVGEAVFVLRLPVMTDQLADRLGVGRGTPELHAMLGSLILDTRHREPIAWQLVESIWNTVQRLKGGEHGPDYQAFLAEYQDPRTMLGLLIQGDPPTEDGFDAHVGRWIAGELGKCPKCKRRGAKTLAGTQKVGERVSHRMVAVTDETTGADMNDRYNYGRVLSRTTRQVPVPETVTTYEDVFRCTACGHLWKGRPYDVRR